MINRVEFKVSNTDMALLDELCLLLGQDRSHVLRLAIRRMVVGMKSLGWPIDLPEAKRKKPTEKNNT